MYILVVDYQVNRKHLTIRIKVKMPNWQWGPGSNIVALYKLIFAVSQPSVSISVIEEP